MKIAYCIILSLIFASCQSGSQEDVYYSRGRVNCAMLANVIENFIDEKSHAPAKISDLYPDYASVIILVSGYRNKNVGDKVKFLTKNPDLIDYFTDYFFVVNDDCCIVIEKPGIWEKSNHTSFAVKVIGSDVLIRGEIDNDDDYENQLRLILTASKEKVSELDNIGQRFP